MRRDCGKLDPFSTLLNCEVRLHLKTCGMLRDARLSHFPSNAGTYRLLCFAVRFGSLLFVNWSNGSGGSFLSDSMHRFFGLVSRSISYGAVQ